MFNVVYFTLGFPLYFDFKVIKNIILVQMSSCNNTVSIKHVFSNLFDRSVKSCVMKCFISLTLCSYGDRSPRTKLGRVFAIVWTLMGLVVTGIMIGDLASSLTVSVADVEKIIYGAKVFILSYFP